VGRKVWADESRRPKTFLSCWANLSRARNTSLSSPSQESKSPPTPSRTLPLPGSLLFLFSFSSSQAAETACTCLTFPDVWQLHLHLHLLSIGVPSSSTSAVPPLRSDCLSPTLSFPAPVDFRTADSPRKATRPTLSPTGLDDRSPPLPSPNPHSRDSNPSRHEEPHGSPTSEAEIDLVIDWRRTRYLLCRALLSRRNHTPATPISIPKHQRA
jgi:hypothetical protein